MSTYIYLTCRDHTPAIQADSESGQHLTDCPSSGRTSLTATPSCTPCISTPPAAGTGTTRPPSSPRTPTAAWGSSTSTAENIRSKRKARTDE